MKLNTKKFIRNIIICVIAWILVSLILNYAPGFKRDKYVGVTKLIINDEDRSEELKYNIYIDENNEAYLSKDDILKFFDKNIFVDEGSNTIITTSNTKIASMVVGENQIIINDVAKELKARVFESDGVIFIPISELALVYNISVNYIDTTNVLVIEELNKGLIQAKVEEESTLKFKPRLLSKSLGKVTIGEVVSCYYTTSKGWRLIRTEDGRLGYVKANVLGTEYIVRQDLNDTIDTREITISLEDGSQINIYNSNDTAKRVTVRTLFNLKLDGTIGINENNKLNEDEEIWATISNNGLEKKTNEMIKDYKTRTSLINTIVSFVSKYKVKGINIDFGQVTDNDAFDRFIIELAPRLREIGISTNVILNSSFNENNIINKVEYLIIRKGK